MVRRVLISTFFCCLALLTLCIEVMGQSPESSSSELPNQQAGTPALPAQTPRPLTGSITNQDTGPVVKDWDPKSGSANSVIELRGYRLHPADTEKIKVSFIQNGVAFRVSTKGGSSVTNDEYNGEQTLDVIVPEQASLGMGQFVVESDGHKSVAATVNITEWKPPLVKSLTPTSGPPGTLVSIECEGFHVDDDLDITDVEGNQVKLKGGAGSSNGTAFVLADDVAEGVITVRIGNKKHGMGQYSEPFTFTVTDEPLPPQLIADYMTSVAPGQWIELQHASEAPVRNSERTEVVFKQSGRTIIVATQKPARPHVEVPIALSPGEVQIQARTWRDGRQSEWSDPITISLAEKRVAPKVNAIRLEQGSWVQLWPGPDRATSFSVVPGDVVVLNGLWPVKDASDLKVSFVRPGQIITLRVKELNEKADWFGDLRVSLPTSLGLGNWRMIVSSETDSQHGEVPLVIKVKSTHK